ncbi:PAS domain-containing protein [Pseudoduganella sp. UC29_106]|uniref:PAS domain-containing protein n=1 Tax=Pseudoduganella sp. UC29_106 TaxID=3374553 RepID=UPI00375792BC
MPQEAKEQHEDVVLNQLEAELQRSKEKLQETIEHAEISNEELRASNEEMQAINEELRSATEELETSKEELQSVNEELITVNYELKVKVEETGKANDDLNNLIASTDIATIFVDRALRIKRFTPRAADIFSIIPSDIGRSLLDITHRLDYANLAEDVSATFETLRPVEREVRSNDGRWYIVRLLPYRTTEDKIEGAVMTFFDITTRKEAEEKLRASEEWVRRVAAGRAGAEGVPLHTMAEARDEFLAVMSQELRHPLNLIYINAELLARMPAVQQSSPALRSAAIIRNAVANQARIIDDLLDMSRLHTGRLAMSCHDEDLGQISQRLIGLLRSGRETETVDLRYECPATPAVVYVDAVRIEQVLLNLLHNALRFTPAGGTATVALAVEEGEARVDVRDTGEGIAAEALPHIFDMYSLSSAAAARNKGGLGIGLALVRQIVELHGGRVDASSPGLGEGSTFTVWLPLSRTAAQPVSGEMSPLVSCVSGRNILLLDGQADAAVMFKTLLELDGGAVWLAGTPADALALLELERFDLLMADVALPGMDSHDFIREVRAMPGMATLTAIATGGVGRDKDMQAALAAGYSAHMNKPLSLDVLCGKLAGLLPPMA